MFLIKRYWNIVVNTPNTVVVPSRHAGWFHHQISLFSSDSDAALSETKYIEFIHSKTESTLISTSAKLVFRYVLYLTEVLCFIYTRNNIGKFILSHLESWFFMNLPKCIKFITSSKIVVKKYTRGCMRLNSDHKDCGSLQKLQIRNCFTITRL